MSQMPDPRDLLAAAEHAAVGGDLAAADQLLMDAAHIQEQTLGPLHPDLVTTLTNRAIVAEKTGRQQDAETLYRRAAEIAYAALPADHPMVAASRQNLDDFCHAWGLPIESRPLTSSTTPEAVSELAAVAPQDPSPRAGRQADAGETVAPAPAAQVPPSPPRSIALPPTATPPQTMPSGRGAGSRALTWGAIGVVALVTSAIAVMRPWLPREQPAATAPAVSAAQQSERPQPPPAAPAPGTAQAEQPPTPRGSRGRDDRDAGANRQAAPTPSSGNIVVAAAELCRTLSTAHAEWQCEPAGDTPASGSIVLYTRLRSRTDGAVTHRWFRGDTLRQSVRLAILANWTTGYRTYSRQIVGTGDWRVEVRGASGELLHEQRFAVQ